MKPEWLELTVEAAAHWLTERGEPAYRRRQIDEAIYQHRLLTFEAMTTLSRPLRAVLAETFRLGPLELRERLASHDGSVKYLFVLADGALIETVWMPQGTRRTVCVSTQVGCKFGCRFCASGQGGFIRNLIAGEILGQVLTAERDQGTPATHLVYMGMGEPLDNLVAVLASIASLTHPERGAISRRRVTVSTCGVVPKINLLTTQRIPMELSISLHAPDDATRRLIMPVNRAYPVGPLLEASRRFTEATKRLVTFEYILIRGLNDSPAMAQALVKRLKTIPCKINLIPYNPIAEFPQERPTLAEIRRFQEILTRAGLRATVRFSKGGDVNAACGQLRLRMKRPPARISPPLAPTRN